MTKDEELSKYLALIEQYKEQINSLDVQFSYVQAAVQDYVKAKITVEELSKADDGNEVLIPIGGSTYVTATAKNTSKLLFDIGAGVVTEKTCEDTVKMLDKRIEKLQQTQEKIASMVQQLQAEAAEISEKAQKILSEGSKQ